MFKEKAKGFITGVVVTTMVLGTFGVFAETISKTLDVIYQNIKIVIDGTEIEPTDANGDPVEPFIYNGTTYLPVRAVGEAFAKKVRWDGETNTVYMEQQGTVTYLDTLAPQSFEPQGRGDYSSVGNNSKYGGGVDYQRGVVIETNKAATLTYSLDGNYSSFISDIYFTIGWGMGPTIVKIYGDDKLMYESPGMTNDTLTQSINLDVSGVAQLKIEVGDSGGKFTFADARLIDN